MNHINFCNSDNIFTNNYKNTFKSGNLVTTLPDHLAQILIVAIQNTTKHKEPQKVHRGFSGNSEEQRYYFQSPTKY